LAALLFIFPHDNHCRDDVTAFYFADCMTWCFLAHTALIAARSISLQHTGDGSIR